MSKQADHSFFSAFFDQDIGQGKHECHKCEATDDLIVAFTTEEGDQVWICPDCRKCQKQERQARTGRNRARVAADLARDHYEESF